jgi:hypothetical protein
MKSREIEDLLQLTYDDDPKVRMQGVRSLCPCHVKADNDKVWNRIFELANDSHRSVRAHVLHALGDGSPREREDDVIRTVEAMVDDEDPKIRRRVRRLLAHYRRTGKINVL